MLQFLNVCFRVMEGCESRGMSASDDVISSCKSDADPPDACESNMKNLSMIDLISCLSESLKVQSDQDSIRGSAISVKDNGSICVVNEDESNDCIRKEIGKSACEKCFDNCGTVPCSSKTASSAGSVDVVTKREDELTAEVLIQNVPLNSVGHPHLDSISVPTPSKLVSAMKGSREKQGKLSQKLSVTWSPDVYDPTPTAESHVPSNKSHRHRSGSKKNVKNKPKGSSGNSSRGSSGNSSRGSSKGKDKKQLPRKSSRSSSRCDRSLDNYMMMVSSSEPFTSIANYDVGSPDQFCGSSFLASVPKLHFPVGEAS